MMWIQKPFFYPCGYISAPSRTGSATGPYHSACQRCGGTGGQLRNDSGTAGGKTCTKCHGTGMISSDRVEKGE